MNILLFSKILAHTGVGNHIKQLAYELKRQGHKVLVISSTNEIGLDEQEVKVCKLPVSTKNPYLFCKNLKDINRIILDNDIDLVHVHHRLSGIYMNIYNKMYKHIPVVYTLHSAPIPYDFFHRKLTYSGDRAIAISQTTKNFMESKLKFPKQIIDVIPNGVDKSKLYPLSSGEKQTVLSDLKIDENKIVIAMHSRIDANKNQMTLVEAINRLPEQCKNKVVVVCSGKKQGEYYNSLCNKISEYG